MKKVTFQTCPVKLASEIKKAQKVGPGNGRVVAVTVAKLRPNSRNSCYGFHFIKPGSMKLGQVETLEDASVRRIEAIITETDTTINSAANNK